MALSSISLNNGATVIGRLLARNGAVTLINNVLDGSRCNTGSGSTPGGLGGSGGTGGTGDRHRQRRRRCSRRRRTQASNPKRTTTRNGTTSFERTPHATCTSGFRATVHGKLIKRVVFTLDGKRISNLAKRPYECSCGPCPARTRDGARDVQGRHQGEDARARLQRLRGRRAEPDHRPLAVHRMRRPSLSPPARRGVSSLARRSASAVAGPRAREPPRTWP